jgi:hypothetical protein
MGLTVWTYCQIHEKARNDQVNTEIAPVALPEPAPNAKPVSDKHPITEEQADTARRLSTMLDLENPEHADLKAAVDTNDLGKMMELFRNRVVLRMRALDLGGFPWHGNVSNGCGTEFMDVLCGLTTREDYIAKWIDKGVFLNDIFGISGAPGAGRPIRWIVDINDPGIDWGHPEMAKWSKNKKLATTGISNFYWLNPMVYRYWASGNDIYLRKCLEILTDFSRNNAAGFWAAYNKEAFGDQAVIEKYRINWRPNGNGFEAGSRWVNMTRILAGLCKCLPPGKANNWVDVLHPIDAPIDASSLDAIPPETIAEIAMCGYRDHLEGLLPYLHPGAPPNQRSEGLRALAMLSGSFPEFKHASQLTSWIGYAYGKMLDENFLPDGGSLEQSFNYNNQDKEGLEELLRFYGAQTPPFARAIRDKVAARRRVDDGLLNPLGGLPQVGNSHDVHAWDIWSSPEREQSYWATMIPGRSPLNPQRYTSIAFPYSGFYVMRSGWTSRDLYLFFMSGRPQPGHSMRDGNGVQINAYGRQLLVCGGQPTYGMFRNADARGADYYLSEGSSLKVNTVVVDGKSQARGIPLSCAPQTPLPCLWHSSPAFDLVDNLFDRGYIAVKDGKEVDPDMNVAHYRRVIFVKEAKLWLLEDRMRVQDEYAAKTRRYSQVWNFLPFVDDKNPGKRIPGFKSDQILCDAKHRRFATTDATGPNVEFRHFGPENIAYSKYYGDRERWLGWYSSVLGDAQPKPDVHASWVSTDSDVLLTLLSPLNVGEASPVEHSRGIHEKNVRGFDLKLKSGIELFCRTVDRPDGLSVAGVDTNARFLLVLVWPNGRRSGLVQGATRLSFDGHGVVMATPNTEFSLTEDGKPRLTTIYNSDAPVIGELPEFLDVRDLPPLIISGADGQRQIRYTLDGAEPNMHSAPYSLPIQLERPCTVKAGFFVGDSLVSTVVEREFRPWPLPMRESDFDNDVGLNQGLDYRFVEYKDHSRLFDLMKRAELAPSKTGSLERLSFTEWDSIHRFGVLLQGYLVIPVDGLYNFHINTPGGVALYVRNPERDIPLPSLINNNARRATIALKKGLHRIRIEYQRHTAENVLQLDVDGPGLQRQPLPVGWLRGLTKIGTQRD